MSTAALQRLHEAGEAELRAAFARDVRAGLLGSPKRLPPVWFYDAAGSELFERITETPEYYLTRTERGILEAHAPDMLGPGPLLEVVELGAGSAAKTRLLLDALLARQGAATFRPVDISPRALQLACNGLAGIRGLRVAPVLGRNRPSLASLPRRGRRLVLFLGSSLGNFEPAEAVRFLADVRAALAPGDALLLGTDMVKDAAVLHRAYNDAAGWNAAFNKNLLARVNRELGGRFDLERVEHRARFVPGASRVEMHLVSLAGQRVPIAALGAEAVFGDAEGVHTENSYKYTPAVVEGLARRAGLGLERSWYDARGWFGVHRMVPLAGGRG